MTILPSFSTTVLTVATVFLPFSLPGSIGVECRQQSSSGDAVVMPQGGEGKRHACRVAQNLSGARMDASGSRRLNVVTTLKIKCFIGASHHL